MAAITNILTSDASNQINLIVAKLMIDCRLHGLIECGEIFSDDTCDKCKHKKGRINNTVMCDYQEDK